MTLHSGTTFGNYEIIGAVGAGGMGEVYRAKDNKLHRDVAIKILPEAFSKDRARVDRFEREARLLAQLNHTNIATIHGLEELDGQRLLVMELVEGETLAQRIARGPLPLDDAISVFTQIADGLEAAHDKGIIHRDLKPANIIVSPSGHVKILDFGLAKAYQDDTAASADASQSPTVTKGTRLRQGFGEAGTQAGVIPGTASYMSPEQARGKLVGKRTDLWAFGCCLYEALTGRKAYTGETTTDTLAAIVNAEPDWDKLPKATPEWLRSLMRRCLRKSVRDRLTDAGWARVELNDTRPSIEATTFDAVDVRGGSSDVWVWDLDRETMTRVTFDPAIEGFPVWLSDERLLFESHRVAQGNVFVKAADGTGTAQRVVESPNHQVPLSVSPDGKWIVVEDRDRSRDLILVSHETGITEPLLASDFNESNAAISPDGKFLAYQSDESGQDEVYVRPFPNIEASKRSISSSGGSHPVWSKDGRELFFLDGEGRLSAVDVSATDVFTTGRPKQILVAAFAAETYGQVYDVSRDGKRFLTIQEPATNVTRRELYLVLNWHEELEPLASANP